MNNTIRFAAVLILTVLSALSLRASAAEDGFPGIKRLMSAEEFKASGLDGLSESELKALNAWLIRYTAGDAEVLQQSNEVVREAQKTYELDTRLADGFNGWSGETIFRMQNGQVWQQRLKGRYQYNGPANPQVLISKNWLGFYRMTLVETGKSIGVTPLRQ